MWEIIKNLFGTPQYVTQTDTRADSPDPDPDDVWAFTDPDARADFDGRGKLDDIEQDIRFEVMRAEPWAPAELEFKREIRRLLQEDAITDKGSYWFSSPFSTVYNARRAGTLTVAGKVHNFGRNDDIVFQCQMQRQKRKSTDVFLIARLRPAKKTVLCGEMKNAMKGGGGMGGGGM